MRWVSRLMTSVAAVLLVTGGAYATTGESEASMEAAWASAVKSGTLEAYTAFVLEYPDSELAHAACKKLFGVKAVAAGAKSSDSTIPDDEEESSVGLFPGMFRII